MSGLRLLTLLSLPLGGVAVLACGGTTPDPGAVARTIGQANAPVIQEVRFRPRNFLDPPEVWVLLVPGSTESDATRLWCEVVVPAGGSHDDVEIYSHDGTAVLALDATC
jgi:hypothetical protein